MVKVVLGVLALLGLVVLSESSCESSAASHANGCSIPYNLPYFFKNSFTPACNLHDLCYACAASHHHTKSDCDIAFFNRIKSVCGNLGRRAAEITDPEERKRFLANPQQDFCQLVSVSYYEAVKHFGASHFVTSGSSFCTASWVASCLP